MLIRGGEVWDFGVGDVRLQAGVITEVARKLRARPGEEVVDAAGGAVIPGLHDHHVHLRAIGAARQSVQAGPPLVANHDQLSRVIRAAAHRTKPGDWIRAVGYHESVAGDLNRWVLDRFSADRPVRVQHRSGALWILNSAALALLDVNGAAAPGGETDTYGRLTGRIWRADEWLRYRVPHTPVDFAAVSESAASAGITGFTDATPDQDPTDLAALVEATERGQLRQRLHLMAPLGTQLSPWRRGTLGPLKVLLDDTDLPPLDDLIATTRAAHGEGRSVAFHCVTHVQATLAMAAVAAAGGASAPSSLGDRIEHGALISTDLAAAISGLGITVVTQPGFVRSRGDQYRRDVEPADQADLWRLASLVDAGVAVAASTDAPFGRSNPWEAIDAAVTRRTLEGDLLGRPERVSAHQALRMWMGRADRPGVARRVRPGEPADLCVLGCPAREAVGQAAPPVRATICDGELIGSQWD